MSTRGEPYLWLTSDAIEIVQAGRDLARVLRQRHFRGPHLLYAAVQAGHLDAVLMRSSLDREVAVRWIEGKARRATAAWQGGEVDPVLDSPMLSAVEAESERRGHKLSAMECVRDILSGVYGIRPGELDDAPVNLTKLVRLVEEQLNHGVDGKRTSDTVHVRADRRHGTAPTLGGALAEYGLDLSIVARDVDARLYETQLDQIQRIGSILGRLLRPSVLLVGDSGVGKSAMVDGLARWIHDGSAPVWLSDARIIAISCGRLIAGGGYSGRLEQKIQGMIETAKADPGIVLFFDELHLLADTSITGSGNLLGLFNEAMSRTGLRVIGASTTKGLDAHLQNNEPFLRRFEILRVKEPQRERLRAMVEVHVPRMRAHYGVNLGDGSLEVLISSCERFMPSRRFPAKAIETLDAAFQKVRSATLSDAESPSLVRPVTVQEVISEETGVPVSTLSEIDQARLRGLQSHLDAKIYDQQRATETMSRAIQGIRLGLKNESRTGGAFLFVGPPGTGKTELAKVLAEYLMGHVSSLVRFNMSEFQTPESYQRLIGPPPGYVGFDAGGELTNRITENPYSVVLFDEIEKGSSRVFDVFLQVLSDGHLTDNHGRVVDCKNSVFIMTSNALADVSGCDDAEIRRRLIEYRDPQLSVGSGPTFRREFIDRLEIVPFSALSGDTLRRIALREVQQVMVQVERRQILNCQISVHESTMQWLVEQIDARATGARSVQRLVESTISRSISDAYLRGALASESHFEIVLDEERRLAIRSRRSDNNLGGR